MVFDFLEFNKLSALRYSNFYLRNIVNREASASGVSTWDKLESFHFKFNLETDNRLALLKELRKYLSTETSMLCLSSLKKIIIGDGSLPGLIQLFCMSSERNPLVDVECNFPFTQS